MCIILDAMCGDSHGVRAAQNLEWGRIKKTWCSGFRQLWLVTPSLDTCPHQPSTEVPFPVQPDSHLSLPIPDSHLLQVGPQFPLSHNQ